MKTPTKSRTNSINRSLSNSHHKNNSNLKNSNLNLKNSRTSSKCSDSGRKKKDSGSRSKEPGSRSKESGSRSKESGQKSKRVVVSQSGWDSVDKEVAVLKKEYKKMVKILDEREDEELRNRLNEIAFAIQ